jgi:isocitrate dehydrogenase
MIEGENSLRGGGDIEKAWKRMIEEKLIDTYLSLEGVVIENILAGEEIGGLEKEEARIIREYLVLVKGEKGLETN